MSESWHSYPSIYALGHKALAQLFDEPVTVEEKIDGSQFSFGVFDERVGIFPAIAEPAEWTIRCRSKGSEVNLFAPEKMFLKAVETVKQLAPRLTPGWAYRAEYLARPRHNSLAYDRVPHGHLILFDVSVGLQSYLSYFDKEQEARRLGLEVVPCLFQGTVKNVAMFRALLDTVSVLGGQKIEGVVVKNYTRFDEHTKAILLGKFVSETFKETHAKVWKAENPTQGDVLTMMGNEYHSQARWQKAVQHLREAGQLAGEPKDIALLMQEVPADILKECEDEIKAKLFKWAWPHIRRAATAQLPEWYKQTLLSQQFNEEAA